VVWATVPTRLPGRSCGPLMAPRRRSTVAVLVRPAVNHATRAMQANSQRTVIARAAGLRGISSACAPRLLRAHHSV
jgi:hypothetical protein